MNSTHLVLGSPSVYHRSAGEVPATSQVKGEGGVLYESIKDHYAYNRSQ